MKMEHKVTGTMKKNISGVLLIFILLLQGISFAEEVSMPSSSAEKKNVLFILDASGSMWGRLDGVAKIVIAKEQLVQLVRELENTNAGLISYGHRRKGDCADIETLVPLGGGTKTAIIDHIKDIVPKGKTPITKSVEMAAGQLEQIENETEIVLISDGRETCDGDPCVYVKLLKEKGIRFRMHVIGFDVNAREREQLECIAKAGGGSYFSAHNASQLQQALSAVKEEVIKAPTYQPPPKLRKPAYHPPPKLRKPTYHPPPKLRKPTYHPPPKLRKPTYHPPPKLRKPASPDPESKKQEKEKMSEE